LGVAEVPVDGAAADALIMAHTGGGLPRPAPPLRTAALPSGRRAPNHRGGVTSAYPRDVLCGAYPVQVFRT
jgi:hypothetical protein